MLLLNFFSLSSLNASSYVSIHLMLLLNAKRQNGKPILNICFNTSYVVIKLVHRHLDMLQKECFNTSYVVIKHALYKPRRGNLNGFNTSYVVIKPSSTTPHTINSLRFNTSYVVIKPNHSILTQKQ